ncbi:hypothetical protein K470DRAFT_34745 [Piedraia hortae CBS 480.64]|uniref:Uncharacterized protein n=1 Tax=Piedraia hortae CBS 480.64 TaxID=1314780 RepID=A0A6A7C3X3_9PEZI|nr:hypothetical protein K470DRAFT_34745 [Piedraia hortae CBS 480.64]
MKVSMLIYTNAVTGIIFSLSICTALGVAVLESPQAQAWIEEQRIRLAELLRKWGNELDPESRRQAEAVAYVGRSGTTSSRSLGTRRPAPGPSNPDEAEERRRKGREYLARRHAEMMELQKRRSADKTFDDFVDHQGNLKGKAERGDDNTSAKSSQCDYELPNPTGNEQVTRMASKLQNQKLDKTESKDTVSQASTAENRPKGDKITTPTSRTPTATNQGSSQDDSNTEEAPTPASFSTETVQEELSDVDSDDLYANTMYPYNFVVLRAETESEGEMVDAAASELSWESESGVLTPESWSEVGSRDGSSEGH